MRAGPLGGGVKTEWWATVCWWTVSTLMMGGYEMSRALRLRRWRWCAAVVVVDDDSCRQEWEQQTKTKAMTTVIANLGEV